MTTTAVPAPFVRLTLLIASLSIVGCSSGDAAAPSEPDAAPIDASTATADAARKQDASQLEPDASTPVTDTCANAAGISAILGGPLERHGACFYLSALATTCDTVCGDLGRDNVASSVEDAFSDHCDVAGDDDISTYFFENGNPGGWTFAGSNTTGHSLGYGHSTSGDYYGKCAVGDSVMGTYPGDPLGVGSTDQRSLVCACSAAVPVD